MLVCVRGGRARPSVTLGAARQAICVSMLRAWSMFYGKVKLLKFCQPARQHALYVLEVC